MFGLPSSCTNAINEIIPVYIDIASNDFVLKMMAMNVSFVFPTTQILEVYKRLGPEAASEYVAVAKQGMGVIKYLALKDRFF